MDWEDLSLRSKAVNSDLKVSKKAEPRKNRLGGGGSVGPVSCARASCYSPGLGASAREETPLENPVKVIGGGSSSPCS